MVKVRVDPIRCQGHARCFAVAPEVFKLDEWGHSYVDEETVAADLEPAARRGAATCPEHAIEVDES